MCLRQRLTGSTDRVQRVGLGARAAGWPLGSADLDDLLTTLEQEAGQAGTVAAGTLDRPATAPVDLDPGGLQQLVVAGGVGAGRGLAQDATGRGERGGGQGVAMGVDADDAIDGVCQHGHAVVLPRRKTAVVGVGLGGVTARHNCDGSQPHGWIGC